MRIQAKCRKHPDANVYLLAGTTAHLNLAGELVDESSEMAQTVALDEANLYCDATSDNHELHYEVVEDDSYDENGNYKR